MEKMNFVFVLTFLKEYSLVIHEIRHVSFDHVLWWFSMQFPQ